MTLEALPPASIHQLSAQLDPAAKTLRVRYQLATETPIITSLRVELLTADRRRSLQQREVKTALAIGLTGGEQGFDLQTVERWSPNHPDSRYVVRATLTSGRSTDTRELICGAADVNFTDSTLKIGGDPVQLRGVRVTGCIPFAGDRAATAECEIVTAKTAGFTALLFDGAAPPEALLDAADRLGLPVIAEVPRLDGDTPAFEAVMEALGHHPCLMAWSWGRTVNPLREINCLRAVDPARLILVRDGDMSRLVPPGSTASNMLTDFDRTLAPEGLEAWWQELPTLETRGQPVLASVGLPLASTTELPSLRGNNPARAGQLDLLRDLVEGLRRDRKLPLLGYFVRLRNRIRRPACAPPGACPPMPTPRRRPSTGRWSSSCVSARRCRSETTPWRMPRCSTTCGCPVPASCTRSSPRRATATPPSPKPTFC